jgi:hypothetical protein
MLLKAVAYFQMNHYECSIMLQRLSIPPQTPINFPECDHATPQTILELNVQAQEVSIYAYILLIGYAVKNRYCRTTIHLFKENLSRSIEWFEVLLRRW